MPHEQDSEFRGLPAGSLERGRFIYFPVAPGRMEFALEVRKAILERRPRVVAVELPATLQDLYLEAIARLPQISVVLYPEPAGGSESSVYVPVEPADPFAEAVRTAVEVGAQVLFTEPDTGDRPHLPDMLPDPYSVRHIGVGRYVELYRVYPQPRTPEIEAHAAGIAWKLQGADPLADVLVVVSFNMLDAVLDAMEQPQEPPRRLLRASDAELVNAHPDCLAEITVEYPYLQHRYEEFRTEMEDELLIDRLRTQLALLADAERAYEQNTGEVMRSWQRRMIARYGRNLALTSRNLVPSLFDLTVTARSIVDDNYAWEVWDMANRYPPQRAESDLETLNLSGEQVWRDTRRIRLRRRLPRPKQRLKPTSLKERKKEQRPGQWASELDGNSICSYPPEDIVVEDFGRFLKKKAKSLLSEERMRVEPFTTSVLDGIDLRETIRNWYEGKIYVKQFDKIAGEVGSVVVIFDEDRNNRYRYLTTWLGEHQNESDMAFYATHPFEHLVGPGIGRAEYGGFLMSLPPRRMYDVWRDSDYDFAETKPERLLLAGLDYSVQKYVVYVGPKAPRSVFRSIAARMNRTILYIPIGQLSADRMKRVRVVHVLDSYARRTGAKDYIW